jgi:hypothetical protein
MKKNNQPVSITDLIIIAYKVNEGFYMLLFISLILIAQFVFQQLIRWNGHIHPFEIEIKISVCLPCILNFRIIHRKTYAFWIIDFNVIFHKP